MYMDGMYCINRAESCTLDATYVRKCQSVFKDASLMCGETLRG